MKRIHTEAPSALQTSVIERFLKGKAFDTFLEDYRENRRSLRFSAQPSDKDIRIAKMYKEGKTMTEITHISHAPAHIISSAINRVGRWQVRTGEKLL